MKYKFLTYNLHFSRASREIGSVLTKYRPDIVFLQELATDELSLTSVMKHGYELADFSNSFVRSNQVYGVATLYKSSIFTVKHSKSFSLPSSLYQMLTFILKNRRNPRTVLRTDFLVKKTGKTISTYNIHFTPIATNTLRIKQLNNTLNDLTSSQRDPLVIAGDFNYPYGRKKLEEILNRYRLKEATTNVYFTRQQKILLKRFTIKLKLDYVFYRNLKLVSNHKIDVNHSDHFPILSELESF